MKSTKHLLKQTAKILSEDVMNFQNVILNAGGGEVPLSILEKKKPLHDIERLIKVTKNSAGLRPWHTSLKILVTCCH